jgi:uncharacterized protein YndB with AHSA1/START domain
MTLAVVLSAVAVILSVPLALLAFGWSKVQPDGSVRLTGEAPLPCPPEKCFDLLLSKQAVTAWWLGKLDRIDASARWPEPGESLSFAMGRMAVTYVSERLERPRLLVARGEYPDAASELTQECVEVGPGKWVYRKTVIGRLKGSGGVLKKCMMGAFVGIAVPLECRRAAKFIARSMPS